MNFLFYWNSFNNFNSINDLMNFSIQNMLFSEIVMYSIAGIALLIMIIVSTMQK